MKNNNDKRDTKAKRHWLHTNNWQVYPWQWLPCDVIYQVILWNSVNKYNPKYQGGLNVNLDLEYSEYFINNTT